MKKTLSLLLAVLMVISIVPMTVFATEPVDSIGSVKEDIDNQVNPTGKDETQNQQSKYDEFDKTGDESVNVYVTKASTYSVTVPKVVILDGSSDTATGEYTVRVSGDIAGTEYIVVKPEASFLLSHTNKDDLTATVEQEKTVWSYVDIATDAIGTITAEGLTAGSWSGSFMFNISREEGKTPAYLQAMYDFDYYSTINLAVNDVNNGTIGENADVDKKDAVAGIYTDENGGTNVVLLKDTVTTERISPSTDMVLNLCGHKLYTNASVAVDVMGGNFSIDGRLPGSGIESETTTTLAHTLQIRAGNIIIDGGTYIAKSHGDQQAVALQASAPVMSLSCYNAVFEAFADIHEAKAAFVLGDRTDMVNCRMIATAYSHDSIGIQNRSTTTLTDCEVLAYNNYLYDYENSKFTASSVGVDNSIDTGSMTLTNCHISGGHSGIGGGTIIIDGGIYEGYGHGGIYFSDDDTISYVKNAIIRQCAMPDGYTATESACNNAGFYIGSGNNITVYMDNCDISGSNRQICMRGTNGEQNNALYISNSNIYDLDGNDIKIRIDNGTHRLYIGNGNNFTIDDCMTLGANPVTDFTKVVFTTSETYVKE